METLGTATYSPEDNKLRFYPDSRLSTDDYNRIRAAGFIWAPKQELFVAPLWTPDREDLLVEWCGEVSDEDKSLVDRAAERADRFSDYSDSRREDAAAAHAAVDSICGRIPLGQPILVGHHSEKRARRDAERIQSGMDRAVRLWDQAQYWKDRAASAVRHAKYLERPDVRARRIKKLEAEKRRQERCKAEAETGLKFWNGKLVGVKPDGTREPITIAEENRERICALLGNTSALHFYASRGIDGQNHYSGWDVLLPDGERFKNCPSMTVADLQTVALAHYAGMAARCDRWLAHYANRLDYERAMMAEAGGIATDRKGPEKGGACRCWASPGHGKGWSYIQKVNRVSVTVLDNWGNGGGNFTRTIPFDKLMATMTKGEVDAARQAGLVAEAHDGTGFYLRDAADNSKAPTRDEERDIAHKEAVEAAAKREAALGADVDAMREQLKSGVQIVSAPNLFPTPPDLAKRMADLVFRGEGCCVQICPEMNTRCRVLEPSAGTGNLINAVKAWSKEPGNWDNYELVAVEINPSLAKATESRLLRFGDKMVNGDFLEQNGNLGKFDRILMNPPFERGADIAHIKHAMSFLNPGGKLVAICAGGSRQEEALQPLADTWEPLPDGTFSEQGTNVRTVLLTITKD